MFSILQITSKALINDFFDFFDGWEDRPTPEEIEEFDSITITLMQDSASVEYVKDHVSHLLSDNVDCECVIAWAKDHSIEI